MKSINIIACLCILIASSFNGHSQNDRTFWQKLFGKNKSENIDTESPKNSRDSLATLIEGHLTPVDSSQVIIDKEIKESEETQISPISNKKGVIIHVSDEILSYADTATSLKPSGYRIQIYLGELNQARRIRSDLLGKGERATMDYNQSDYIVRIGDYRTYMEAEEMLSKMKKQYPYAHVIKDKIVLQ